MAGNYPNVPSWRMAWDRDGTQAYRKSAANVMTALSAGDMQALNDESNSETSTGAWDSASLVLWFPEVRDLDGWYVGLGGSSMAGTIQVSANTTNGIDGTWTQVGTFGTASGDQVSPGYRTIISNTSLSIRAIRFNVTSGNNPTFRSVHLFGEPIPGANPNRLALWHPTLDQRIAPAHFDWGDVPRSSSEDRQFRVKNLSATLTANSVRVAQEILTDANPSVLAQHTLSIGGGAFLAQVNAGDLGPGALSGVVTLRRVTPSNAQLSVWAHRVFAEANTWS